MKPLGQCGLTVISGSPRLSVLDARAQPHPILLPGGECLILRTTAPQDAERLQDYVPGLSGESRRNRFLRLVEIVKDLSPRCTYLGALAKQRKGQADIGSRNDDASLSSQQLPCRQ
jgi:hypothetical protein